MRRLRTRTSITFTTGATSYNQLGKKVIASQQSILLQVQCALAPPIATACLNASTRFTNECLTHHSTELHFATSAPFDARKALAIEKCGFIVDSLISTHQSNAIKYASFYISKWPMGRTRIRDLLWRVWKGYFLLRTFTSSASISASKCLNYYFLIRMMHLLRSSKTIRSCRHRR